MLFASAGEITCSSFSVGNRAAAFSPSFVISIPVDRMYFASGRSLSQFVTTYNVSLGMTSGRRASSPAHARTTLFAVQTHLATTPASHRVHHEEMSVRKHSGRAAKQYTKRKEKKNRMDHSRFVKAFERSAISMSPSMVDGSQRRTHTYPQVHAYRWAKITTAEVMSDRRGR